MRQIITPRYEKRPDNPLQVTYLAKLQVQCPTQIPVHFGLHLFTTR
jgi:hypothetical protein